MKKILLTAFVMMLASPALACEGFHNSLEALEEAVSKPNTAATATTPAPQPAPSQPVTAPPASPPASPVKK